MKALQVIVVNKPINATTCGAFGVCYGVRQSIIVRIAEPTTSPFKIRCWLGPVTIERARIGIIRADRASSGQKVLSSDFSPRQSRSNMHFILLVATNGTERAVPSIDMRARVPASNDWEKLLGNLNEWKIGLHGANLFWDLRYVNFWLSCFFLHGRNNRYFFRATS